MPKRLRKWNDLAHAAAWLTEQTGESWEALDLANAGNHAGLRLYVHFRFPPGYELPPNQPPALVEGCMTEIVFNQDLDRLTQTDEFLLKLFRFGDGKHFIRVDPGLPYTLDEIRVMEADLVAFLGRVKGRTTQTLATKPETSRTPHKRHDRLKLAIEAALAALCEKLTKPTAGDVFDYLAQRDETGIIEDSTEEKLIWRTSNGELRDTTRKALQNRMTGIWKENPA